VDILTTLAKVGAFMFALLILFPIVVGPIMYIGMAVAALFAGVKPEVAQNELHAETAKT